MRGPAAIDGDRGAGDRGGSVGGEEHGEGAELLHGGEALVRLLREQHVADHLLARDAMRLRLAFDLRFDQRCVDIAGADGIAGDAGFRDFERGHLGEPENAVLRRHIGRLVGRADERRAPRRC